MDFSERYTFTNTMMDADDNKITITVTADSPEGMDIWQFVEFCKTCARAVGYSDDTVERGFSIDE